MLIANTYIIEWNATDDQGEYLPLWRFEVRVNKIEKKKCGALVLNSVY